MNICIPIETDQGIESEVYGHFGSAPGFLIVDTDTLEIRSITNNNEHHAHGMCQPVAAIAGEKVDGIVVGGIGGGALMKFNQAGYKVFYSQFATVKETVAAFKAGTLREFAVENACGGHNHGGGCS